MMNLNQYTNKELLDSAETSLKMMPEDALYVIPIIIKNLRTKPPLSQDDFEAADKLEQLILEALLERAEKHMSEMKLI